VSRQRRTSDHPEFAGSDGRPGLAVTVVVALNELLYGTVALLDTLPGFQVSNLRNEYN
jgi:hypothetical protein